MGCKVFCEIVIETLFRLNRMYNKCLNLKEQTQKPVKRAIFRKKLPACLLFCKVCATVAFLFILEIWTNSARAFKC